ncbi:MAG: glycosyltransferase family 2 protein [Sphingobacteriales bacterium]|nr:MAG: glycosyltransferase family 2 protein [Sphingobacteriales bacterium]
MINAPSFSVVLPAYNNAATVIPAIESILHQTYPPLEVIVIDDGSTDSTPTLVQTRFGDLVRLLIFPENQGPAAARNAGLEQASGTHIAFLDADDTWLPQKLEAMAGVLHQFPDTHLLFHAHSLLPVSIQEVAPQQVPFRNLLWRNPVATPCAVVRNDGLRFDNQLRWMEDWDFFLRAAEAGPVMYLPQPFTVLGRPILSAGGQSSAHWQMRKAEMQVLFRFARRQQGYWPLVPGWILFILAKHLYQSALRLG